MEHKPGLIRVSMIHVVQALCIAAIGTVLLVELLRYRQDVSLDALRTQLLGQGLALRSRLEAELSANIQLAEGLAATIESMPALADSELERILAALFARGTHLRNIAAAPGNRIRVLYPLEGNESALGLSYAEQSSQWPEVQAAIARRTSLLAGPVALVQGGSGLIHRTPVFLDDGSYWGLVSLVIDMPSLLADTSLATPPAGTSLLLYKVEADAGSHTHILGNADVLQGDPVSLRLNIPGVTWMLALAPTAGWSGSLPSQLRFTVPGFLLVAGLSIGYLVFRTIISSLRTKDAHMRAVLDSSLDSIIVVKPDGSIDQVNRAACNMFGHTAKDLLGQHVRQLCADDSGLLLDLFEAGSGPAQQDSTVFELQGLHRNGEQFAMEVSMGALGADARRGLVWILRDITERKNAEAALVRLASTDPLTGAMNRRAFMQEAERLFGIAQRFGRDFGLLSIDADHFKRINDNYGHEAGDLVLQRIVSTLKGSLRRVDLVSRFGGEEFVVLLPETDAGKLRLVADKLLGVLAAVSVQTTRGELRFTCSIGLAHRSADTRSLSQLLREADQALYQAKAAGRNRVVAHSECRPLLVHPLAVRA